MREKEGQDMVRSALKGEYAQEMERGMGCMDERSSLLSQSKVWKVLYTSPVSESMFIPDTNKYTYDMKFRNNSSKD